MSWRRAALDQRLEILEEQVREQLAREDGGLRDWLEHQIKELMTVAASSDHGDYLSKETGRVLAALGYPADVAARGTGPLQSP